MQDVGVWEGSVVDWRVTIMGLVVSEIRLECKRTMEVD